MFKYLDPLYFFIGLSIGLFFTYISTPIPEIVIKYPTPENAGKIIYRDNADVCYKYKAKRVECPNDETKIKPLEIQHVNNNMKNDISIWDNIGNKILS